MARKWIQGLGVLALVAGCSGMQRDFEASQDLLTATGHVKVSDTGNNNHKLTIEMKHLAKPEKVQPGAKVFVLWAQPTEIAGAPVQNLGAFTVDDDLKAAMEAITPHSKFDLFVTAESSREAMAPTGKRLMWSKID